MITLTRIDHKNNMARFYSIAIQPDMFGGVQLIRQWGRIGTHGCQELREHFASGSEAQAKHDALHRQKLRRGYAHE